MSFDIDRMKEDGVSSHLIELAKLSERSDTAMFEKIAMGLENTEIFKQFISMESNAPVWDYMYAAGMCTRGEADWFKSEENPYNTIVITFGQCDSDGENIPFQTIGDDDGEDCQNQQPNPIKMPRGTSINPPTCATKADGTSISDMNSNGWFLGKVGPNSEAVTFPYTVTEDTVFTYCEPQEG